MLSESILKRRVPCALGVATALVALGVASVGAPLTRDPSDPQAAPPEIATGADAARAFRAFQIREFRPDLNDDELSGFLDASDALRDDITARGARDVSDEVHRLLRKVEVTPEDVHAFWEAHRDDLFGGRSYARSRTVADRLVRIRAVRAQLDP